MKCPCLDYCERKDPHSKTPSGECREKSGSGAMSREQDREMLEKAAKAAGYEFEWYCRGANNPNGVPNVPFANGHEWRPLDSDADAFRLMVDCSIDVRIRENHARASNPYSDSDYTERFINHRSDNRAATRRAITRAAAAMSEGQEG